MDVLENILQGSQDWLNIRAKHFTASEVASALGVSKYLSRNDLLKQKHTGMLGDISDYQQSIFDKGHESEEMARLIAEELIGEDLYPVTATLTVADLPLLASYDGITIDNSITWEHKLWSEDLAKQIEENNIDKHYTMQLDQQLLISGSEKCLFMTSDGTRNNCKWIWYETTEERKLEIIKTWQQFQKDLSEYQPRELTEKPQASAIMQLPALSIQIKGEVIASNLPAFKADAETFIANINTDLKTDDDFANAEATVKYCKDNEDSLEAAKKSAIAQTTSIDEVMRTIDFIKDQLRTKRLDLDKKVKTEKANIKTKIITDSLRTFKNRIEELDKEFYPVVTLTVCQPNYDAAMKNKRTLASLHNAADTELSTCTIKANETACDIRKKLSWLRENAKGQESLFPDLQTVICKDMDDFQLLVNSRIEDQKKKVEEAAAQKIIDDAEAAKKLTKAEVVEEKPSPEQQETQITTSAVKTTKSARTKQQIAIQDATDSLAAIIESTPPQCDLSTVIVSAIAEGKINHVTINY